MKKLLLTTLVAVSGLTWADCSNTKTSFESQKCLSNEVKQLRIKMQASLQKSLAKTEAKKELQDSQASWVKYKEDQCGAFVVADTMGSPATVEYDLACQSILYKQRIELLESLF